MFNVTKIQASLRGLVGFRQPLNPDYAILDLDNQVSTSGYFVNDNPYAKIQFIKEAQDYIDIDDAEFNAKLVELKNASIVEVCSGVFSRPDFIDRNLLYRKTINKVGTEALPEGFVGYRIIMAEDKNIALKITRCLLDFDGVGDIKLLLFDSAQKAFVKEQTVTIASDHQEVELNWEIDNTSGTYKSQYYLGYINSGLAVNPFKRSYEDSNRISYLKYLEVDPILVKDHTTEELFDVSEIRVISESTGLNFDITVYEDFTDHIINSKSLFSRAIYLATAIRCLTISAASLRSNKDVQIARDLHQKIMAQIDGVKGGDAFINIKGLRPELMTEIAAIKNEIDKQKEALFAPGIITITEN